MKALFKYWAPVIVYMAFIMAVSIMPAPEELPLIPYIDKFYHLLTYLVLGVLLSRAFNAGGKERTILKPFAFAFLYGALIEVLQSFTPYRSAEALDAAANGLGGLAGSYIYLRYKK